MYRKGGCLVFGNCSRIGISWTHLLTLELEYLEIPNVQCPKLELFYCSRTTFVMGKYVLSEDCTGEQIQLPQPLLVGQFHGFSKPPAYLYIHVHNQWHAQMEELVFDPTHMCMVFSIVFLLYSQPEGVPIQNYASIITLLFSLPLSLPFSFPSTFPRYSVHVLDSLGYCFSYRTAVAQFSKIFVLPKCPHHRLCHTLGQRRAGHDRSIIHEWVTTNCHL